MESPKQHGGPRPGSGRPTKMDNGRNLTVRVGDRQRRKLDRHVKRRGLKSKGELVRAMIDDLEE